MKHLKRIFAALVLALVAVFAVSCNTEPQEEVKNVGIEVTTLPTKTAYMEGESFDKTGMVVVVVNSKEEKTPITEYTVDKTVLKATDTKVVISYEGFTAEVPVTVQGPLTIAQVFAQKNNAKVVVEGIVYEVTSKGFYLADSLNTIYVSDTKGIATVAVGDAVKVEGEYGYLLNFPQIKNLSAVTNKSAGNAVPVYVQETTLAAVVNHSAEDKAFYGSKVKLQATVNEDASGRVYLVDVDGKQLDFDNESSLDAVKALANKRVQITVIVAKQSGGLWEVLFGSQAAIEEDAISVAEVEEIVSEDVDAKIPAVIYGALSLPTAHKTLTGMTYVWSTTSEFVTIVENVPTVVLDAEDHQVELVLTATLEGIEVTKTYTITSKAIVERTLPAILADTEMVDKSVVITQAVVITKFCNQGRSVYGAIVKSVDGNETLLVSFTKGDGTQIDYTKDEYKNLKAGDQIKIKGLFRLANTDFPRRIQDITEFEVVAENQPTAIDESAAWKLETKEDYAAFNDDFAAHDAAYVKIVNPYFGYVNSSSGSWINISYDHDIYNGFGPEADDVAYIYAFQVNCLNITAGTQWWEVLKANHALEENASDPVFQVPGLTIYAFIGLYGPSYAQFVMPTTDYIQYTNEFALKLGLADAIPASAEAGSTIELPSQVKGVDITWTTADNVINVETGLVADVAASCQTTLVAHYVEGGEEKTIEVTVSVIALVPLSVHELKAGTVGQTLVFRGVFLGIHAENQGSAFEALFKDEATNDIIGVTGLLGNWGSHMPETTLTGHGTLSFAGLKQGDVLKIKVELKEGTANQDTGKLYGAFVGTENAVDLVVASGASIELDKTDANIITVSSQSELQNLVIDGDKLAVCTFQVVKFSGTLKAIFYNGSKTASKQTPFLRFFFEASDLASQRFAATGVQSSPCFLTAFNNLGFEGSSFTETVFGVTEISTSYGSPAEFTGDLYAVFCGGNSSSNYAGFIVAGPSWVEAAAPAETPAE